MRLRSAAGRSLLALSSLVCLLGADWSQFRGPNGAGTSEDRGLPVTFSETENLAWKVKLPGRGSSSPVTAGDRIFLTCYTGYGQSAEDPGDISKLERHLLCLNRADGSTRWQKTVEAVLPEEEYRGFLQQHGYASSTPAIDGERVYVFHGKSGVLCYDFDGNEIWRTSVGTGTAFRDWGSGTSPVVYNGLVILNANAECKSILALDKNTGEEAWKAEAENSYGSWSTPIVATNARGDDELLVTVPYEVWSFNPTDGKFLWYAAAADRGPVCPSLVARDDVIFAVGSQNGGCTAIRIGGTDDATESNTVWKSRLSSYIATPVLVDDYLYWVDDQGAVCLDATNGEEIYRERIPGVSTGRNGVYASPVAADGKIYATTRTRGVVVLAAKPEFEVLAVNTFESDASEFNATPAVSNGQLLIRSDEYLYCVGQ